MGTCISQPAELMGVRASPMVHRGKPLHWGLVVCMPESLLDPPPQFCDSRPQPKDIHITVATQVPNKHIARQILRNRVPFTITLGSVSTWVSAEREIVKVAIESPELQRINKTTKELELRQSTHIRRTRPLPFANRAPT